MNFIESDSENAKAESPTVEFPFTPSQVTVREEARRAFELLASYSLELRNLCESLNGVANNAIVDLNSGDAAGSINWRNYDVPDRAATVIRLCGKVDGLLMLAYKLEEE